MQIFDEAHRAIHYPPDRRFRVWINPWFTIAFAVVVLGPIAVAWGQYLVAGLPTETSLLPINFGNPPTPHGFPAWLRLTHFVNFFFLMLLIRSGFSILMDHPRLYWNRHCTPNSEWMRLTPLEAPTHCEGGRSLHLSLVRLAGVSAHRGHGALVAFPFGLRIPS
jgi:sulfoxide reductase catalytic subunit YedY